MIPEGGIRIGLLGNEKCLRRGGSVLFWKPSWLEDCRAVFASFILACLACCGWRGGRAFATSAVRLRLSGYGVSGTPHVTRCWQILATSKMFLWTVNYWPTEGRLFTAPVFLFSFPSIFHLCNLLYFFTLCFWCSFLFLFLYLCVVFYPGRSSVVTKTSVLPR
jgi:hypothetical protein